MSWLIPPDAYNSWGRARLKSTPSAAWMAGTQHLDHLGCLPGALAGSQIESKGRTQTQTLQYGTQHPRRRLNKLYHYVHPFQAIYESSCRSNLSILGPIIIFLNGVTIITTIIITISVEIKISSTSSLSDMFLLRVHKCLDQGQSYPQLLFNLSVNDLVCSYSLDPANCPNRGAYSAGGMTGGSR